jgi:hypothetical protein
VGRIEIRVHGERPGAQACAAWRPHQPATIFNTLARSHVVVPRRRLKAQPFGQWRDDAVANALRATAGAQLSLHSGPVPLEVSVLAVGQQAQLRQLARHFEPNERFRQRGSKEGAVI